MAGPLSPKVEQIAEGVWRVAGDLRHGMNVFLIEDEGGVTQFDAGTRRMADGIRKAAEELGGLKRIVLGHSHADHRSAAPELARELGAPVLCHRDEVSDAEGDGGAHYFSWDKIEIAPVRWIYPTILRQWDGGPVKISDTVGEGDEIAGFKVVHFPGNAPGLIGLWRESDRLALVSDTIYVVDAIRFKRMKEPAPPESPQRKRLLPKVQHPAFNWDTKIARESIGKLAALEPTTVWSGHMEPVTGKRAEVRVRLERAAEARFPRE
jgi:glyoxylase-like metal-dependent hydrolase (beta-lactamase superfamily II)